DGGVALDELPTPLALAKAFNKTLSAYPHPERSDLAAKALADALGQFALAPKFKQESLFETTPWDTWRTARSASAFCELSRLYLAKLTERYLRYFLDREAASVLATPERVASFRARLRSTVDEVSQHAFETSKIAQSFAAGWFEKNTKRGMPHPREVRSFLSYAFHKIR